MQREVEGACLSLEDLPLPAVDVVLRYDVGESFGRCVLRHGWASEGADE